MQISSKVTQLSLLLALTTSPGLLAQETESLNGEQSKRVEELNTQIQNLTEELNRINGISENVETGENTGEAPEAVVAETQKPASEVIETTEEEEEKIWSGEVEFGYVDSTGNTEETTIKSGFKATREKDQWRYNILGNVLNTEKEGDRSAEKYFLSNRLAYQYNEHDYSFAYASYDDDRFSGFDYQATVAAGYGRRLLNSDTMKWDAEIGPGYRISKVEQGSGGSDSDELILRAFSSFSWDFSESANFSQTLNVETGEDNTISKSVSALKMSIVGELSMKISYTVKYTDTVPADNDHADTETAVTLSYNF